MSEEKKYLVITDDLKPVLEMLKPEDASAVVELREELSDNWQKKQIFRTETEMRISVLNDAKHPTNASKYWQSVREQGAMFDALLGLTFDLRRNKLARRKLEQEQKEEYYSNIKENLEERGTEKFIAEHGTRGGGPTKEEQEEAPKTIQYEDLPKLEIPKNFKDMSAKDKKEFMEKFQKYD